MYNVHDTLGRTCWADAPLDSSSDQRGGSAAFFAVLQDHAVQADGKVTQK